MKSLYNSTLAKLFPPPRFLAMPSVGIDVSDHSVRFFELKDTRRGLRIGRFGEKKVPDGVVASGKIQKPEVLKQVLAELRDEHKLQFVRAALPEEGGYLFELSLPLMQEDEILGAVGFRLEENVPISPEEAVFDYDVLHIDRNKKEVKVVVTAFPENDAQAYAQLLYESGLIPVALEIEPIVISRAVVPHDDSKTHLVIDFGRGRSGISVVSRGIVRFSTTTNIGTDSITEAFARKFSDKKPEEILYMHRTGGLHIVQGDEDKRFIQDVMTTLDTLVRDAEKHLQYWNSRVEEKQKHEYVSDIIMCGGGSNLAGLPEYFSQQLQLPVKRANVWTNVLSLEEYIPKGIPFHKSLGYAPAIGLALGSVPSKTSYK